MIVIHPSPTADTRTCDWSKVTKEQLLASSVQHIADIRAGLKFFQDRLEWQAGLHDHDKISDIDGFHADFRTGFAQKGWWDNHRAVNRHHLTMADGIPENVDLIDVLDFIVDCVMAGMARSGSVYDLSLPPELLERAFQNTVTMLKSQVRVERAADQPPAAHAFCGPFPEQSEDERSLRFMLALRCGEPGELYGDDGELQLGCLPHSIDFRRDSVAEIRRKLDARAMAKLAKQWGATDPADAAP